ncbi:sensor domain-containing diguanylate cyclase [Reinekea blandensis]|uniref:diguanylate cyclase n=1 Tax=Reinekea blandensis MED297 TaxID=314283 RepID=A4BB35_9GAMM|nr:sensor domain-containing diguanylate cyclase [Reinekea blandensis]EAR10648.1 hypothetical protein MED297_11550 [Reinekea sp. MED297] [Reinekea blandensis MED297]
MTLSELNMKAEALFRHPVPVSTVKMDAPMYTPEQARFDRVVKLTSQVLKVPVVNLSLVDNDHLWLKHTVGMQPSVVSRAGSCCGYVAQQDGYLEIPDLRVSRHRFNSVFGANGNEMRFYAGYPVHDARGRTIGSFCIMDDTPRVLSAQEREWMFDLKEIAEGQLHSVELSQLKHDMEHALVESKRDGVTDALTGVWNRKGILHILEQKLNVSERTGETLGVVYADIDHFKRINDTYGHAIGDEVLVQVADRIRLMLRNYDALGRIGGEEFLVLVLDPAPNAAQRIAERIRQAIEQRPVATRAGDLMVSMSLGVAVRHDEQQQATSTALMAEADRCLYQAKNAGRNCVHGPELSA